MDKHNFYTLKGILMADVVIGLIIYLLMKLTILSNFTEVIFLGLTVAYLNLALNTFYTTRMFKNKNCVVSYFAREVTVIIGTAAIAYIVYLKDSFSALIFLGGYCIHFIALIAIALKDLNN